VTGEPDDAIDRDRLASLFATFNEPLTRFAIRRVGDAAAADVVSETFLVAWRRRDAIPTDHPGPWLYTIALNIIRHEIRSSVRRTNLHERTAEELQTSGRTDDETAHVADALLVRAVLAQLSAHDQEVLRLAEWDGLSPAEGAAVLDCSVSAFKVRLFRARRRFAAELQDAQAEQRPAGRARANPTNPTAPSDALNPLALDCAGDDRGVNS
jgi:RNA polymerase sigma factor (sigma-70 family)